MKNKGFIFTVSSLMVLLATIITMSCNKKFDEPPAIPDTLPDTTITNNIVSIKTLKALHAIGGLEQITKNYVISAVVSSSDESGNFYKAITIQDSTGGITLTLDRSGLYNDYPIGRRIYVKCQSLYISDYGHTIQLGVLDNTIPSSPSLTSIPSSLFDKYIVKGTKNNTIAPKIVTLAQLKAVAALSAAKIPSTDSLQSTLIQLNNVQLAPSDVGYVYGDTSAAKKSVSRNLTDCIGTTGVVMYNSGYSNFVGFPIPAGKGTLLGIFVPYGSGTKSTAEIEVRDTSDVKLYDARCGAAIGKTLFSETFTGITTSPITTGTDNVWQNIAEVGGFSFVGYVAGTPRLASISGFVAGGGGPAVIKSWMITKKISIPSTTNTAILNFVSADGYYAGATFQALVSTDYNGSATPSTSTWTVLPATISSGHAKFTKAIASGDVDLSAYIGKDIYLAWRYSTTDISQVGTGYEFGSIQVKGY